MIQLLKSSSLQNSLRALGLVLHHAKTDSLPVEQVVEEQYLLGLLREL